MKAKTVNETIKNVSLLEMANISPKISGINNVVIWIGKRPDEHWHRIKVSNVANKASDDCFTIKIPGFETIGNINTSLITDDIFEQIKIFVSGNIQTIINYSDGILNSKKITEDLLSVEEILKNNVAFDNISETFSNYKINEKESWYMTDIDYESSGIENIIIWVGQNPDNINNIRIKVGNIKNDLLGADCFIMTIPRLSIIGKVNNKLINDRNMDKIKKFISLNMKTIIDYSMNEILTDELFKKLKKI